MSPPPPPQAFLITLGGWSLGVLYKIKDTLFNSIQSPIIKNNYMISNSKYTCSDLLAG